MSTTQAIIAFIGGLITGYLTSYLRYYFETERSRFDFKTKILREVWEAVLFTKSLAANLDPPLGRRSETETHEQRRERLLPAFFDAHLKAKRVVRFNAPFYPAPLHDLSNEILIESEMAAQYFNRASARQSNYHTITQQHIDTLRTQIDRLESAIRQEVDGPSLCPLAAYWRVSQSPRQTVDDTDTVPQLVDGEKE